MNISLKTIDDNKQVRAWLGATYMNSKGTLKIPELSDLLGDVTIRVEQHPVNPLTCQYAFSVGMG